MRRILHYHLPPRGFWTWWCGGMAVYDALVVAAWIAINVIYTQQRVALILPIFKGNSFLTLPDMYAIVQGSIFAQKLAQMWMSLQVLDTIIVSKEAQPHSIMQDLL